MENVLSYRNLAELFHRSLAAISSRDKVYVEVIRTDRREVLTFRELAEDAKGFAAWLGRQPGLGRGDKLALVSKNQAAWDIAFWGAVLAGMVPVLIDPERGPQGVIGHLEATDARGLVLADDYGDEPGREELREFAAARNVTMLMTSDDRLGRKEAPSADDIAAEAHQADPEDTAVILCTSGTTGDPREVELTHANLVANIQGSIERVNIGPSDVLGHILPPHHSFGMTVGKLLPLAAGATSVYTNRYREVSDLIRDKGITIFIAIPALYTTLAKKLEEGLDRQKREKRSVALLDRFAPKYLGRKIRQKQGWTALRFFLSGAAPMPRWVLDVLWRRGFRMYEGYGTTENSPVYGFNDRPDRLGSVGRPIRTLTVKIVDENHQTLPPHERGEICLGGPCIMKGYYRNPQATADVIETDERGVRWLRTGDLGYLDPEGNLYITGRKKYLIVLPGGKNVNPERVETALSEARFVREVLVVPTRREDGNGIMEESVRVLVQPDWDSIQRHAESTRDELTANPPLVKNLVWESIRICQQQNKELSAFERIAAHQVEIQTDEFVKTSTGKIVREHYARLDHLEARHMKIAACASSRAPAKSVRRPAGT